MDGEKAFLSLGGRITLIQLFKQNSMSNDDKDWENIKRFSLVESWRGKERSSH